MPRSKEAKRLYRQKKRAKKAAAKAAVAKTIARKVAVNELGGGGRYTARTRLRGSGSYLTDAIDAVSGVANYAPKSTVGRLASTGASALSNEFGVPKPISSALGNAAGWLTKLFGFGSYSTFDKLKKNSFLGGTDASGFVTNAPPTFAGSAKQTSIRIRHDEYVCDIMPSINFSLMTFAINPGNAALFPWGSQIANLYEEYVMHGMVMEFRSMSATAVGTTSSGLGTVTQATDYDPYDSNYTDKRTMENSKFATSGQPFLSMCHPIECDRSQRPVGAMFVQRLTSPTQVQGDARMDFLGNYSIATVGQQTTTGAIGELWVHYDVELFNPMLEGTGGDFSQHVSAATAVGSSAWTYQQNTRQYGGFSVTNGSGGSWNSLNFDSTGVPVGLYVITARTLCSAAIQGYVSPTFVCTGGVAFDTHSCYDSSGAINNQAWAEAAANGVNNIGTAVAIVRVTGGGTFSYRSCYSATGTIYVDVVVNQLATISSLTKRIDKDNDRMNSMAAELSALKLQLSQLAVGMGSGTASAATPLDSHIREETLARSYAEAATHVAAEVNASPQSSVGVATTTGVTPQPALGSTQQFGLFRR